MLFNTFCFNWKLHIPLHPDQFYKYIPQEQEFPGKPYQHNCLPGRDEEMARADHDGKVGGGGGHEAVDAAVLEVGDLRVGQNQLQSGTKLGRFHHNN